MIQKSRASDATYCSACSPYRDRFCDFSEARVDYTNWWRAVPSVRMPRGGMVRNGLRGNVPSSPTATYVLRHRSPSPLLFTEPLRSLAPSHLQSRTYPYPNLWLPSTLQILPPHHPHHHVQSPPLHLFLQPPPPSLQRNPVLHPHLIRMASRLESDLDLT